MCRIKIRATVLFSIIDCRSLIPTLAFPALFPSMLIGVYLWFQAPVLAQDLAGAVPTTLTFPLYIDPQVEEPPVFSGTLPMPRPSEGDSIALQVFMPDAAGKEAYAITVFFDDPDSVFTSNFDIVRVRSEVQPILGDETLDPEPQAVQLTSPEGSPGPLRAVLFINPWTLSNTGLIAVIELVARKAIGSDIPLVLNATATVMSETPPTRLLMMTARQEIGWR